MRAAVLERFGGPDGVTVRDWPRPRPGRRDLLVRVRASSLNPLDWKLRSGSLRYKRPLRLPRILGCDLSGVVEEAGASCRLFRAGDEVFGFLLRLGAHAEYALAREWEVGAKPAGLTHEEAASLPAAGCTMLQALRGLRSGHRILVNGASGGIGTLAVQWARLQGALVTGVARSDAHDLVRSLGARRVVDYTRDDVTREPTPYDVVFDVAPSLGFARGAHVLSPSGLYVTTLPRASDVARAALGLLGRPFAYGKRCRFVMVWPRRSDLEALARETVEGRLRPVIAAVHLLEDIRRAHEQAESGHPRGKVVVRIA